MKKKALLKYLKREWKVMEGDLQSFLKNEEQEDLHRFRIQAKRIEAFLMLLDQVDHHSKLVKCFSPVKKMFQKTGALRNRYIINELIPGYFSPKKSLRKFRSLVIRYRKRIKKARLKLLRKIKPVKRAQIFCFYQDHLQQITRSLNGIISDDGLHEFRKRIKVLLYNYKPFCGKLALNLDIDYLEKVDEAIGRWHDQLMISSLFGKNMLIICQSEDDSLEKLRSNIIGLTHNFYQRVNHN